MNIYGSGHGPSAVMYHALRISFVQILHIRNAMFVKSEKLINNVEPP